MNDFSSAQAIRDVIAMLAHTIDGKRWQALRPLFADDVETDYTSLFGGEVQRQKAADLIGAWRQLLSPLTATQHLVGPIEVHITGAQAMAGCHVRGYHYLDGASGGPEWMVAGHWALELVERAGSWTITRLRLDTFYQTGNRELLTPTQP